MEALMIIQLLGLLDVFAGLWLGLLTLGVGSTVGFVLGVYVLVKGVIFISDVVSFMDILAGITLLLAASGHTFSFTWIFVVWLLQKGFFSFIR